MPRPSRTRLPVIGLALFSLTLEVPVAALAQPRPYLNWPGKTPAPETAPATPLERALPNAATGQPGFDIPPSPYGQVGNPYRSELNWRGKSAPDLAQAPAPKTAQTAPRADLASNWTPQPQSRFDAPRRPSASPMPQAPVPAQPAPQAAARAQSSLPRSAPQVQTQPEAQAQIPAQISPQAPAQIEAAPLVKDRGLTPADVPRGPSPAATNPVSTWKASPAVALPQTTRPGSDADPSSASLQRPRLANPAPLPEPTAPVVTANALAQEIRPQAQPQPQAQARPQSQPAQSGSDSGYRLPPNSKYAGRVSPELEMRSAPPALSTEKPQPAQAQATQPRDIASGRASPSVSKVAGGQTSDIKGATAPSSTPPLAQAAEEESAEPYTPFVPGSRATSPSQAPRFYSLHRAYGYEPDPAPHTGGDLALDPNAVETPAQDKSAGKAPDKVRDKAVKPSKSAPATEGEATTSHPKPAKDKTL